MLHKHFLVVKCFEHVYPIVFLSVVQRQVGYLCFDVQMEVFNCDNHLSYIANFVSYWHSYLFFKVLGFYDITQFSLMYKGHLNADFQHVLINKCAHGINTCCNVFLMQYCIF